MVGPEVAFLQEPNVSVPVRKPFRFSRNQTIGLVFGCSVFGTASQILIKTGATGLTGASVMSMVTNPYLVGGYGLYGFSTILLILALKDGIVPRFGRAEDIARTVRFLLTPDCYITGQVISVDGGATL